MKQIWIEGDKESDSSLLDDLCWVAVVATVLYFGYHLLRWVIR